nr:antitoxin Xre/MbcA/ParS toxin-binding domain-containing protein [Pseudomonas sp. WCS374]
MRELAIVAPCTHAPAACWGAEYRCFHLRYEQILVVALQVLGNRELAKGWMRKPRAGFGDNPPCFLLTEQSGYAVLYDWLMRIEHGILT